MRVLDLFSGIGGFSLGLERAGMETVAFCEYDEKCRQVLTKHWPEIPQYNDVRTLTKEQLDNDGITDIGLICGGPPCQPASVAGKREGEKDDRWLWPEAIRLLGEVKPEFAIFENPPGLLTLDDGMAFERVLSAMEAEGYEVESFLIPACAVGAFHRRDRVWIVAHAEKLQRDGSGEYPEPSQRQIPEPGVGGSSIDEILADSERGRGGNPSGEHAINARESSGGEGDNRSRVGAWLPESNVGRVANGVPGRVDRLKQLGNSVVPQIVEVIGNAIIRAS